MEPNVFDKVHEVDLKKTMEQSYIDYAMSVISARALPDVRDGLKPVQRRVLYSMIELNNGPDKPHRKCARIVGDTMGKYHPHGDSSIYGALVNMAQEWSTRYPLVDGHGNFGSVDGDGAAAMRYTEARLSKISMEMLADINKDTVDFVPNFDETEREPLVLPSRYPNLLVNGTSGIAVGMATNIPPHNLREIIGAVVKMIDNRVEEDRETSLEEIMEIVKGPDFPTGATILGRRGIEEAYRTGRAKIKVRAVTNIETMANGKSRIIVTELPYMVNKARLIEKIADLVKEKKIDGITYIGDESMKDYVFYPFSLSKGMNKFGKFCKKHFGKHVSRVLPVCIANLLVFFLVGVWHGPAWKFIVYGLYNGIIIAASNLFAPFYGEMARKLHIPVESRPWRAVRILRTFLLVNISWYFDMAVSLGAALTMMKNTVTGFSLAALSDGSLLRLGLDLKDYAALALSCTVLLAVSLLQENHVNIRDTLSAKPLAARWCVYLMLLFSIPLLGQITMTGGGFIYAQF